MKTELQTTLHQRYPLIFAGRPGIACGDGWFDLIDTLCERLQDWTDHNGAPQIVAHQVKEKFGELRFYPPRDASQEQRGMIWMAESMSSRICEQCGRPGALMVAGAVMTRCPDHAPADAMPRADFLAAKQVGRR